MAEVISESSWKAFTRKQSLALDDKDLLKALARFDKTDSAKPEPRSLALSDVVDQGKKQVLALARKKSAIEKELGAKTYAAARDELGALIDSAEALLKQAREALLDTQSEQDDADSPALLTSRLVPLIRELRKGEATMYSLVAVTSKEAVVLISRKAISLTRGKLLKEQMADAGGAKLVAGQCRFEDGTLTFTVQATAAGLAKKLKAALLAQTEQRLKVRVRGEGPNDVEEDLEDAGEDPPGAGDPLPAPTTERGAPQPAAVYQAKLTELMPRVTSAARARSPDAPKHGKLLEFAAGKAEGGDFLAAVAALKQVERLLDNPAPASDEAGGADPAAAFKARLAALVPKLKEARTAGLPRALEASAKASEAGMAAGKRDFVRAQALLDESEALMAVATPGVTSSTGEASDDSASDMSTQWTAKLAEWTPAIKAALSARGPDAATMARLYSQATALAKSGRDMVQALALLTQCHELATARAAGDGSDSAAERTKSAVARWTLERDKVAAQLQAEIKFVVGSGNPRAGNAELELTAVLRQLKGDLTTKRKAAEMTQYLRDDEVVADVNELAFDLKTPLLGVLAEIAPLLPD